MEQDYRFDATAVAVAYSAVAYAARAKPFVVVAVAVAQTVAVADVPSDFWQKGAAVEKSDGVGAGVVAARRAVVGVARSLSWRVVAK